MMRKAKKSFYNMCFGILNQIIILGFGLIVPKIFIVNYGSEVNGLQSSIAYVYTYIALLESGIGTATIQALFGPVARQNKAEVNSILAATNIQYKKVAKTYLICMLIFSVVYPVTISTSIDRLTISMMILLSGISSLVSFWAYGKFVLLLQVDGKSYIVSIVGLFQYIMGSIIKIVLILLGFPFITVYFGTACLSFVILTIYSIYRMKAYTWVDYSVTPNIQALKQSKNVLVHQISSIVCNSTDVLVLTYVVRDLRLVSIYNIYIMIFDAVKSLILNIFSSVNFIMGQTYNTNIELYRKYHQIYEVMDMAVSFTLYSVAYVLILPFLRIYTSGITDVNYIDKYLPFLFVIIKLLTSCREPASQLINYAGHFKKTQWRSVFETVINVVVSVGMSLFLGIYGVLLGTIIALLYRTVDMYLYTSRRFLNRSVLVSIKYWVVYMGAFLVVMCINSKMEIQATGYIDLFVKAVICGVLMVLYYALVTSVFNWDIIRQTLYIVKNRLKKGEAKF